MELLPAVETLQWLAEHGPADPRRRADRLLAHASTRQARALDLRAARRRRRARPGGRAVRHAAGRRRRRADGRQRRRPQALAARARWRASGSRASSPAPGCPRACCASCTATPTSAARSSRRPRSPRCASRARRAPGARSARPARAALKRSVLELGGKDAMLVLRRRRTSRRAARGAVWARVRERRAVRRQRRARVRPARGRTTASSTPSSRRRRPLRVGDPRRPATEIGPLVTASASTRVRELVDDARGGTARRCTAAGRSRSPARPAPSSRRPC